MERETSNMIGRARFQLSKIDAEGRQSLRQSTGGPAESCRAPCWMPRAKQDHGLINQTAMAVMQDDKMRSCPALMAPRAGRPSMRSYPCWEMGNYHNLAATLQRGLAVEGNQSCCEPGSAGEHEQQGSLWLDKPPTFRGKPGWHPRTLDTREQEDKPCSSSRTPQVPAPCQTPVAIGHSPTRPGMGRYDTGREQCPTTAQRAEQEESVAIQSITSLTETLQDIVAIQQAMIEWSGPPQPPGPSLCWGCGQPGHIHACCPRKVP
ncbi:UNVERIFIED_CONTAM: hypothetical protein FKN15_045722 [Acipenser sinensis]